MDHTHRSPQPRPYHESEARRLDMQDQAASQRVGELSLSRWVAA
jgi:hypothetical protein